MTMCPHRHCVLQPETISVRECVTRECQPEQCIGAPQLTVET